jgi:hypothetical protein
VILSILLHRHDLVTPGKKSWFMGLG